MHHQKSSHIYTKIVFKPLHTNLFYIVLLSIFLTLGNSKSFSQDLPKSNNAFPLKNQTDTTSVSVEVLLKVMDSTKTDSIKPKKAMLESKVKRKAVDYERIDQKKKRITLYNEAEVYYEDIELKSGIIVIDYQKSEVYAGRIKDSTGKYTQLPVFKQGQNIIQPDSIRFNFK